MKTAAIVNPQAGHGRCQRRWDTVQAALREAVGPLTVCATTGPGHARIRVRELLEEGYDHIISAGGDGTHFEVVNGWFAEGRAINPAARMTPLPMGSGSDLSKSLGIPPGHAGIAALADAHVIRADVGRLCCATCPGGEPHTIYFINIARIGIGGRACRYVNEHSKGMGGFLAYLRAILHSLATYRAPDARITLDGNLHLDGPLTDFSVAKGQFDAGGLHMAPHARLDNGRFDCYHIGSVGFFDALRSLPKLYAGRLSERRDLVKYLRATHIEATAAEPVEVEADGEFIGYLPATLTLLPAAIRLTCARRTA